MVRILIGVLIAMLAIYGATHYQPSDDAATLASGAFGILIAVLSLYLIASGIKSVPSYGAESACSRPVRDSDNVPDKLP
jgi:succinate-acetate transporter protein